MKRMVSLIAALSVVFLAMASIAVAEVPNLMNYQGHLTDAEGAPLDTTISMIFTIYDDSTGGSVWWTETQPSVVVANGLFNVLLGLVNPIVNTVFAGTQRWLGITVGDDPEISPRTQLVTVPYAFRVATVDGASGGVISGDVDIQSDLTVSGKATIGPGHTNTGANAFVAGESNTASGYAGTVGGGYINTASGDNATVDGGYENTASGHRSTVGGGEYNTASVWHSTVSGGQFNTASGFSSTVGGGEHNTASVWHSTVSGGLQNTASGERSTVGGGVDNDASGDNSTVDGGWDNTASGDNSTVGGGVNNDASGDNSTVGGGESNTASENYSTVGGGMKNVVEGYSSAILGGYADTITSTADYSYLFGIRSKLTEDSTFMVDMPHIRFGDETNGYEFPVSDGSNAQVMSTDGSGQLSWVDVSGGGGGWTDDGTVIRLETSTDSVGIGTATPTEKLDVSGNIHASGTIQSGSSIIIDGVNDKITATSGTIDFDNENIVTTGKVGIGTASPTAGVDVNLSYGFVKCGGASEGDILMAHFNGGGPGAAVHASCGSDYVLLAGDNPSGTYAGEFHGDVYAYGDVEVSGVITSSGTVDFSDEDLITTGNVGIATASPTGKLDVNLSRGFVKCGGASEGDILMAHFDGLGPGAAVHASCGSDYVLLAGDTYAGEFHGDVYAYGDIEVSGTITSNLITTGNVGIATASPTAQLDVNLPRGYVKCGGGSHADILRAHFDGGGIGAAIIASLGSTGSPKAYLAFDSPTGSRFAGYFDGDVETTGRTTTSVLEITGGMDLAEPFTISEPDNLAPGTVVIIDPDNPGQLKMSTEAYDFGVAGIVSGAGGIKPGVTLRQQSPSLGDQNVALVGRVYCLVDASYGPIQPGDLLTTSNTPGHAMKATDRDRAYGAVIGKAMTRLEKGQGLVLVLVNLQ